MKAFMVFVPFVLACTSAQIILSPYGPVAFRSAKEVIAAPWVAPQVVAPWAYTPQIIAAPRTIAVPTSSQYHAQDELGQFHFGHAGDNQAREEVKTVDGSVRGAYRYVDPNGKLIHVQYLADNNGFRVLGANNLPEAPALPAPIELKGPEPVQDTPEVVAARADFAKKFSEAEKAADAAPEVMEEKPVEEVKSRRRRDVVYASPLLHHFSTPILHARSLVAAPLVASPVIPVAKTTIKTQELSPIDDAPTPANTKKAEIKEKETEIVSPLGQWILPAPIESRAIVLTDEEKKLATVALPAHAYSPIFF